jgi:hypothetical protein
MRYTYQLSDTDISVSIWDSNGQAIQVYRKNQSTWIALINDKDRPGCKAEKMFKLANDKPKWEGTGDSFVLKPKINEKCPDVALQYEAINNFIIATKAELPRYRKAGLDSLFVNNLLIPSIDLALFLYWDKWSRGKLMKLGKLYKILNNSSIDSIFTLTQVALHNYFLTGNITSKYTQDTEVIKRATITNEVYYKLLDKIYHSNSLKEFKSSEEHGLIYEIKDMLEACYDIWVNGGIVYVEDLRRAFDSDWVPSDKALHGFIQIATSEYFRHTLKR